MLQNRANYAETEVASVLYVAKLESQAGTFYRSCIRAMRYYRKTTYVRGLHLFVEIQENQVCTRALSVCINTGKP